MKTMTDNFMPEDLSNGNNEKAQDKKTPSPVLVPLMYLERFADCEGIPKSDLQKKIDQGHIPIVVVGRRKMVNLSLLTQGNRCR